MSFVADHALDLAALLDGRATAGQLVHLEVLPERSARHAALARPLLPRLWDAFGVDELWTHQAAAVDLARAGRSVAVASGTASGKSLCFRIPIAEAVTTSTVPATAVLVFPTKALARDQLRAFADLELPGLVAAAYDGDCSVEERQWARANANVLLTNPEMLHYALLPNHGRWSTFLRRLRFVVVDEVHAFRGVFGTHVAHVLRRLRRVAAFHAASLRSGPADGPTFIGCSATIGDPAGLATALWGSTVEAVTDDGSPRGRRLVALWRPPEPESSVDLGDERERRGSSAHAETAGLLAELVADGRRAIAFTRSRRMTEVVAADTNRRLPEHLTGTVRPYRGGYLPAERREIEEQIFDGLLRGVVATNALELGVDIGGLDACVLDGFPGTIASFWQQAGPGRPRGPGVPRRAGGRRRPARPVAGAPPGRAVQPATRARRHQPGQPLRARPPPRVRGLRAAPHPRRRALVARAARRRRARPRARRPPQGAPPRRRRAHRRVARPGVPGPGHRAAQQLRPRAPHRRPRQPPHRHRRRGQGLRDGAPRRARTCTRARPGGSPPSTSTAARPGSSRTSATRGPWPAPRSTSAPRASTTSGWWATSRCASGGSRSTAGSPATSGAPTAPARWSSASRSTCRRASSSPGPSGTACGEDLLLGAGLEPDRWPGTLHAVEHAAIGILPLFAICDRWDVGGVSTLALPGAGPGGRPGPAIVIYDGYPGGAGVAELGFGAADRHLAATLDVLEGCRCSEGCPSCVQSPKCGNWNEPLDKAGAIRLLRNAL